MEEKIIDKTKKMNEKAQSFVKDPMKLQSLLKDVKKKVDRNNGVIGDIAHQIDLFIELISAWKKGKYKDISKKSIVMMIGALLYFFVPTDVIPDFLFGAGFIDDAAVIGLTLKKLKEELERFEKWKKTELH